MQLVECPYCGHCFYAEVFRTKQGYRYEKTCLSCGEIINYKNEKEY